MILLLSNKLKTFFEEVAFIPILILQNRLQSIWVELWWIFRINFSILNFRRYFFFWGGGDWINDLNRQHYGANAIMKVENFIAFRLSTNLKVLISYLPSSNLTTNMITFFHPYTSRRVLCGKNNYDKKLVD